MALITHQTVRLARGKHESPAHGVCVLELASMLAGEQFSDHPVSVCPIIGAFLRSYNDCIDGRRRQDLYPYAAKVVGSRVPTPLQRERVRRLAEWGLELEPRFWWHRIIPSRWRAFARRRSVLPLVVGRTIAAICTRTDAHPQALALIDELLAIGPHASAAEWDLAVAAMGAPVPADVAVAVAPGDVSLVA